MNGHGQYRIGLRLTSSYSFLNTLYLFAIPFLVKFYTTHDDSQSYSLLNFYARTTRIGDRHGSDPMVHM